MMQLIYHLTYMKWMFQSECLCQDMAYGVCVENYQERGCESGILGIMQEHCNCLSHVVFVLIKNVAENFVVYIAGGECTVLILTTSTLKVCPQHHLSQDSKEFSVSAVYNALPAPP